MIAVDAADRQMPSWHPAFASSVTIYYLLQRPKSLLIMPPTAFLAV